MATNIVNIASDGDVILTVGNDKKRLRASSLMLSAASPVFKALLGPHFREGQRSRSSTSPVEISLPEDDEDYITELCQILYHDPLHGEEPETEHCKPSSLLELAQLIDKYDCSKAFLLPSRGLLLHWAIENNGTVKTEEIWDMVKAAYLLREPVSFEILTKMMIMNTATSSPQSRRRTSILHVCLVSPSRS